MIDHLKMLFEGIAVGFMASVPLGPIGVICIQRTLNGNHRIGFVSGMGAATADTIYAILAVFSLSLVTSFIEDQMHWLKAIGGILVIILGLSIFYKKVGRARPGKGGRSTLLSNYLSVLFLTLTNPSYILIFVALFAAMGVSSADNGFLVNLMLIVGVLIGATSWWFSLTWLINKLRKKFSLRHIWWINKITGSIIMVIGILVILSLMVTLPESFQKMLP